MLFQFVQCHFRTWAIWSQSWVQFLYIKNRAFFPYSSEVSLSWTPPCPTSLTHMLLFRLALLPCGGFLFFLLKFSSGGTWKAWKRTCNLASFLYRIIDWLEQNISQSFAEDCVNVLRAKAGSAWDCASLLSFLTKPTNISQRFTEALSCTNTKHTWKSFINYNLWYNFKPCSRV